MVPLQVGGEEALDAGADRPRRGGAPRGRRRRFRNGRGRAQRTETRAQEGDANHPGGTSGDLSDLDQVRLELQLAASEAADQEGLRRQRQEGILRRRGVPAGRRRGADGRKPVPDLP